MLFSKRQKSQFNDALQAGSEEMILQEESSEDTLVGTIAASVPLSKIPLPNIDMVPHDMHLQNGVHNDADASNGYVANGHAANGHAANGHVTPSADTVSISALEMIEKMSNEMAALREETVHLHHAVKQLVVQQTMQQNVFDTLHTELSDYKNDFVGARMKPMISTMLFLHDAMSQFRNEVGTLIDPPDWLGTNVLSRKLVESNLVHFQDQMDEAMRMCEVNKIEVEEGEIYDIRTQKVISVEPTKDIALDKRVQKIVRPGWKQGGKVFRPTEVAIWKLQS